MSQPMELKDVNPHIFRANSIRGIYGQDLTESVCEGLGLAFASFIKGFPVAVAADHRLSSPSLKAALIEGLLAGGCDVGDAGTAPKGTAIFAAGQLGRPLIYISASHLPAEWNGLKFIQSNGCTYNQDQCEQIRAVFYTCPGKSTRRGQLNTRSWREEYVDYLASRLSPAASPLKLLVDSGNGTAALLAPELFARQGFGVTSLFPELDGRMPNRTSELTAESLRAASAGMTGHDLGLAFDGDADRVMFLDPAGEIVDPERFAFVMLRQLARSQAGPVVANIACGQAIAAVAARFGRELHRVATGAPLLVGESVRLGAIFGMEASSHMIIPSVVPYDDAVAVAGYAAWALSRACADGSSLRDLLAEVPVFHRKRVPIAVPDASKARVMSLLKQRLEREGYAVESVDGLRVTLKEGWVLIRASGTEPAMRLFAEAGTPEDLERLLARFHGWIDEAIAGS